MIFEKMSGGRLLEVVQMQPSEQSTKRIFRNLIEGIAYLHSKYVRKVSFVVCSKSFSDLFSV